MSLSSLNEEMNRIKDTLRENALNLFKEEFDQFFKTCPEVKALAWRQYTPYFNDGDECIFSVHDINFGFNDASEHNVDYWGEGEDGNWYCTWSFRGEKLSDGYYDDVQKRWISATYAPCDWLSTKTFRACIHLESLIHDSTEAAKFAFGDHASVFVSRDNIIVDEYEHD